MTTDHYWAVYDIDNNNALEELNTISGAIFTWFNDSSAFVGELIDKDRSSTLVYFDHDGSKIATIMSLGEYKIRYPNNLILSSDGKYLAIKVWNGTLLLADMKNQEVIDTCLSSADGITWSPDNSQIAFLEPNSGTQDVYVFDLDSWSYRVVAQHIVQNTSWDKIIGWRDN